MNPKIIPLNHQNNDCNFLKAQVKGVGENSVMIDTGQGVVNAVQAFSCLVKPQANDTVLVSYDINVYHILSVLERPESQSMTLSFPSDVQIKADDGEVNVLASKDIKLSSAAETSLLSARLNITSGSANVLTEKLNVRTQEMEGRARSIQLHSDIISTVAKQVSQRAEVLVRWVEKVETLNIGSLIQNVRKTYSSHSQQAVITAKKDMRIDGERIHMG
jgi:hypothetical protein